MTDLTIEDELNLIKRKPTVTPPAGAAPAPADPMAQLSTAWQDATKPAAKPAPKTPEEIDAELGLPPAETGLDAVPEAADTWDVMGAAWRKGSLNEMFSETKEARSNDLVTEMWGLLSEEGKKRVWEARGRKGWASMAELITAEAGRQAATSPDVARVWSGYPLSIDAFNQQIIAKMSAEDDEAQAILDQPGGGFAEFLGSSARTMSTPENLALSLVGGPGGGAIRFIVREALLNGFAEGVSLPDEFRAAEALGNPDPDPVSRIAMGAALGGTFAGAIVGIGKGFRALKSRAEAHRAGAEARPDGVDVIDHEADLDAAEAQLRGEQTVQERLGGVEGGGRAENPADGTLGDILDDPAPGALPPVTADAPEGWTQIRNGIFAGESGGDYNALFGYQNRKGGVFGNVKLTQMTVDQAIEFSSPKGRYGQWVKNKIGRVATPMGAYQIVGTTLRAAKKGLGLKGDEVMTPELQELLGQWIYRQQGTGAWEGYRGPRDTFSPSPVERDAPVMGDTSRGYTGQGQVAVGDDTRIDVDYEVVDYASLIRASGDLQPRDRSRINSDDWVAATAARLDPAQLMPSPTADRGTPIVGPDGIIESGNGRSMAIARAYERHPDRAEAYRGEIERAGFEIPEGMTRPVLIARRKTPLDDAARRRLVIDAQDSGVAQMTPTEVAKAAARGMNASILSRLDPSQPLVAEANGSFVRAALGTLPRSARNAMFDAGGALNALGQRQLREAIFARAWPDPDVLARYTEGAPAELKSLVEALEQSAPAFAALKADIEAGLVAPEMDISGFVLDAMRLIGAARELAGKQGMPIAKAVSELLDEVDLLTGPVAPLTAALVRKMWRNGRAAPADDVASFLTRYADEARKAGASGGMFEAPSPGDVLRTVDPDTFANLPEDYGQARGFATRAASEAPTEAVADRQGDDFDAGAQSPAAEAVHADIEAELRGGSEAAGTPLATLLADVDPRDYVVSVAASQPFDTLEQLLAKAAEAQARLVPNAQRIADELGITFKNPGLKDATTAAQKVSRKGYSDLRSLTDISRGGFVVDTIEQADRLADALAETFTIIDEGWVRKSSAYTDRKIMIVHPDGMLSEVQIWTARMYDAKKVGTEFYDKARSLPANDPEFADLQAKQIEVYSAASEGDLSRLAYSADGTSSLPNLREKRSVNPSSDGMTLAVAQTSRASTDVQSAPGESLASAKYPPASTLNSTAGRPSQSVNASNFMGEVLSPDTSNIGTTFGDVNPQSVAGRQGEPPIDTAALALDRARSDLGEFADLDIELADGTTARAGDILDDIDADQQADAVLQACGITQGGAQ